MSVKEQMAAHGVEEHPFFVGEGFTKLFKVPAGKFIGQHAHNIGHESVLLIGRVIVRRPGSAVHLNAPAIVDMPAHVAHSIEAVTDSLWACNWPNADGLTDVDELERRVIA